MTDIWFYHLQRQPLEKVLPILLEKTLERGWKAVVQTSSLERMQSLDNLLWTYSDTSFLPHASVSTETPSGVTSPENQPVCLVAGHSNPNQAQVCFCVDDTSLEEALPSGEASPYTRMLLLFDGRNEDSVAKARLQWSSLKTGGHTMSYWQQGESGGWEKKA